MSIASADAPIISTLYLSSTPDFFNDSVVFNAVCPPIVGRITSGLSFSIIALTNSGVIGSIYVASANSGSVIIVAGLEFISITRHPSSFIAFKAWVPE